MRDDTSSSVGCLVGGYADEIRPASAGKSRQEPIPGPEETGAGANSGSRSELPNRSKYYFLHLVEGLHLQVAVSTLVYLCPRPATARPPLSSLQNSVMAARVLVLYMLVASYRNMTTICD
jgi:hypothetical protein